MPEIPGHGSFIPGDSHTREPWHLNQQTILRAGILGAIAIALFTEIMNVVVTFSVLHHAASYNSWMAM